MHSNDEVGATCEFAGRDGSPAGDSEEASVSVSKSLSLFRFRQLPLMDYEATFCDGRRVVVPAFLFAPVYDLLTTTEPLVLLASPLDWFYLEPNDFGRFINEARFAPEAA